MSRTAIEIPLAQLDRENAFLLYATFCGDVVRTAHALGMPATMVLKVADEEGWQQKLAPIIALKQSNRPGDVERAINRALNFVQAHQMRMFVARVIQSLTRMTEAQFVEYVYPTTVRPNGQSESKLSTRALADLASAMEKCQAMSYQALNDTTQERVKRKEGDADPELSAADMSSKIAAAMGAVKASLSPRAQLLDAQLVQASLNEKARVKAAIPVHPNDRDD